MNMKKIAPAAMSALLFGSALVPVASANEQQSTEAEVPQIQIDPVHIFNDTRLEREAFLLLVLRGVKGTDDVDEAGG